MRLLSLFTLSIFMSIFLTSCAKYPKEPIKKTYYIEKISKIKEGYRLNINYYGMKMKFDITQSGSCLSNGIVKNKFYENRKMIYYINRGWSCTLVAIYHYENKKITKKIYDHYILKKEGNIIKGLIKEAINHPEKYIKNHQNR